MGCGSQNCARNLATIFAMLSHHPGLALGSVRQPGTSHLHYLDNIIDVAQSRTLRENLQAHRRPLRMSEAIVVFALTVL